MKKRKNKHILKYSLSKNEINRRGYGKVRSDYKKRLNEEANRVWEQYKTELTERIKLLEQRTGEITAGKRYKTKFKSLYFGRVLNEKGNFDRVVSPSKLTKEVFHSKTFFPELVGKENILTGIKSSGQFDEFRKAVGWKKKIDLNKITWDKKDKIYKYVDAESGKTVAIRIYNSPKDGTGATFLFTDVGKAHANTLKHTIKLNG